MQTREQLEAEKIALTKQYEKILEKINNYSFGTIASDSGRYKELTDKRDAAKFRIEEIKRILDS